jgi:hypothetical protein
MCLALLLLEALSMLAALWQVVLLDITVHVDPLVIRLQQAHGELWVTMNQTLRQALFISESLKGQHHAT